jgi:hypothetical protein
MSLRLPPLDSIYLSYPGTYTISVAAYVVGGNYPIPATGIDYISYVDYEFIDNTTPIIIDSVVNFAPVNSGF